MNLKTYFRTVCFLFFLTASFLFASGSWYGEVSLSDNVIPVDSSLVASIINLQYIPFDPVIKQELDDGKATISYEYVWTFSPGGQIENGQGECSCKGKFSTVSSTLNDKTVSVNVTAEVIYLEDSSVVDSDSHNFYANLTVFTMFDGVDIKAANGIDYPDPYIPAEGSRIYKAVVSPAELSGSYEWSKQPSDTEVINIYPSDLDCEVRSETTLTGDATLKVRFTPKGTECYAEDSLGINVFRANIVVGELREDTEEEPGAYIPKGGNKTCSLQLEGFLPDKTTIILSCNNPGKVSLWDGETEKTFPSECFVSALPKNLMLKGENTSDEIKDITLTLTTSKGGSDSAVITVFEINLDWDGLSDEAEEETGLYIPLNDDDDDTDSETDLSDNYVSGENDTRKLIIRAVAPHNLPGNITLVKTTSHTKEWWYDTKQAVYSKTSYSISDDLQSDTWLWVEGNSVSDAAKDVEYKISYTAPDETQGEDVVKATVFKVDVSVTGLSEETEEETGLFLPLNDDDDNSDTILDKDEHPVSGENDLREAEINIYPSGLPGTATLSWGNNIKLWDSTSKDIEITQTQYPISQLPQTFYVEGYTTSSSVRDTDLSLSYEGVTDTVKTTVYDIAVEADYEYICAGGDNVAGETTLVTAIFSPPVVGLPIYFSLSNDQVYDDSDIATYYNVGADKGNLSSGCVLTDNNGQAVVQLASSEYSSNWDEGLYYSVAVKATYDNIKSDTTWVEYDPPYNVYNFFLDPNNPTQRLDELTEGDTALNRLKVTAYEKSPLSGHTIEWKFKFWTMDTLDDYAFVEYGVYWEDLDVDEQVYIFNNHAPDYEGNGPSVYGQLTPSSDVTDSEGLSESLYTAGSECGYVEIYAIDTKINVLLRQ